MGTKNPEKLKQALQDIVLERALLRVEEKNHAAAVSLLKGLLLEFPENEAAARLLRDISRKAGFQDASPSPRNPFLGKTKDLVTDFIRKHHPRHLDLVDTAWEVFKEISPADMAGMATVKGLGFAGNQSEHAVMPKVIVMLVALSDNPPSRDEIYTRVEEVGGQVGASEELINRLAAWAVDLYG